MADCLFTSCKFADNFQSTRSRLSFRKGKKNRCRISRRKRKKVEYIIRRKKLRLKRNSLDRLSLAVFDLGNMNCGGVNLLEEVNEWSYRHELSYWKSRAMSLQFENLRLTDLVQKINNGEYECGGQPEYECRGLPEIDCLGIDNRVSVEEDSEESGKGVRKSENMYKFIDIEEAKRPNKEEEYKKRQHEVELYGSMAPKIKGMETAMQLNYDMYLEKHKPAYWPNIPLNL